MPSKLLLFVLTAIVALGTSPAHASVTFWNDRTAFEAANPDLTPEDFEEGRCNCAVPSPLDSTSDNAAFQPGEIPEGVSFLNERPEGFLLFTSTRTKELYSRTDDAPISIDLVPGVGAFATDLAELGDNDGDLQLDVYSGASLVHSETVPIGRQGAAFGGFTSDRAITRVVVSRTRGLGGFGVDNVLFGQNAPVPLPAWSKAVLALVLASAGFLVLRR